MEVTHAAFAVSVFIRFPYQLVSGGLKHIRSKARREDFPRSTRRPHLGFHATIAARKPGFVPLDIARANGAISGWLIIERGAGCGARLFHIGDAA
jgi:hypothetical protein